jgi:hypothetical protein
VAVIRTDVSEERIASIFKLKRISEQGTTLAVANNCSTLQLILLIVLQFVVTSDDVPSLPILFTLMMEAIRSSAMYVLTRATLLEIA